MGPIIAIFFLFLAGSSVFDYVQDAIFKESLHVSKETWNMSMEKFRIAFANYALSVNENYFLDNSVMKSSYSFVLNVSKLPISEVVNYCVQYLLTNFRLSFM